ncbi:MAG: GNAT family N-acetyltransferase [Methylococcus sp.]
MDSISLGLLRDDEIESLQRLAAEIWHASYAGMISAEQIDYMLEQRYQPALLRQRLARGDRMIAARVNGRLAGFAHAFPVGEGACKLDKLYVSADLQRRGIGARLLGEVERFVRGQDCHVLMLRVNKRNDKALAAYRKYGFEQVSELVEDIGGGFVMDDYVLAKRVVDPENSG